MENSLELLNWLDDVMDDEDTNAKRRTRVYKPRKLGFEDTNEV